MPVMRDPRGAARMSDGNQGELACHAMQSGGARLRLHGRPRRRASHALVLGPAGPGAAPAGGAAARAVEPPRDRVPGPQSRAAHLRRTHVKAAAFPLFLVCVSTCFGYNSFMLTVRAAPPTARARSKTPASHRPALQSYE